MGQTNVGLRLCFKIHSRNIYQVALDFNEILLVVPVTPNTKSSRESARGERKSCQPVLCTRFPAPPVLHIDMPRTIRSMKKRSNAKFVVCSALITVVIILNVQLHFNVKDEAFMQRLGRAADQVGGWLLAPH